ncbi:TRAP transporter small permease [Alcaligenes parafaecalis]|uniref:TRAP transporter small permease protein n=1 Tax=Alcaligenes parafaecalis TaxID=171260 RepID=A0ABT3VTN2_9BURK|nr:TRAP transporter small permease [Alcaligenes parafaecalis]MCX5465536.1 TRAP transporter small permease [Alcaligenes parafaecalis]
MIVLERMARVCGALAALFLCLIGVVVTAQIVARLFSMQIPASDDFAGWFMAASIFLALPYAMLHGDHIRVSLLLQVIPDRLRRPYELLATLIGIALAAWCTWETAHFVYESFIYKEVAQGMVAVPLWIPQLGMPIGLGLLTLMLLRRLLRVVQGQELEATEHG